MKKLILGLLLLAVLAGCSTEGKIKVINRTKNELYFTIKGDDYTLDGATEDMINDDKGTSKTVSFDTGRKFLMFAPDETEVNIYLEGETFIMAGGDSVTTVEVEPNETYRVYADPTHAGMKLINNSELDITELKSTQIYDPEDDDENLVRILSTSIPAGTEFFKQLDPVPEDANSDQRFFYQFKVTFQDSSFQMYGYYNNPDTFLKLDDFYEITID